MFIKDYYLSLSPRLRVPDPPSCVHRDTGGQFSSGQDIIVYLLFTYCFN